MTPPSTDHTPSTWREGREAFSNRLSLVSSEIVRGSGSDIGWGPLPGVMAVAVYTTMSLDKLYSETIEGIDPAAAITAAGITRLQILRSGSIP
jgi:hypothetical protein